MRPRRPRAALVAAMVFAVAACSSGGSAAPTSSSVAPTTSTGLSTVTDPPESAPESSETTEDTRDTRDTEATDPTDPPPSTAPGPPAWRVDTDVCVDPAAALAPIEEVVSVGSVMPLTGGIAAATFAPVAHGLRAYIDHANEERLLGDVRIELTIEDDQYDPTRTQDAVRTLVDAGVDLFTAITGTDNNLAVRRMLNDGCYPQLNALTGSVAWGDAARFPWTTGLLVPATIETKVYASQMVALHGDGATAALLVVDNDFGAAYADALATAAEEAGVEIVGSETIDAADGRPPTAQLDALAALRPDAILAVPIGAGCITFLTELAATRMRHPGWEPDVFITSTCADGRLLTAAGGAADGIYTSGNQVDVADPANASRPAVTELNARMAAIDKAELAPTAAIGWTAGEVTVAILRQAQRSDAGLSRASIIEAARHLVITPGLASDGVVDRSMGEEDPFLAESLQLVRFDAADGGGRGTFTEVGPLVTSFETTADAG